MFNIWKKFIFIIMFLFVSTSLFSQKEAEKSVNVKVEFKSPRNIRILEVLKDRSDAIEFCDNFYDFYFRETNKNNYYIVEKYSLRDTLNLYDNILRKGAGEIRTKLLDENEETIYVIPKY